MAVLLSVLSEMFVESHNQLVCTMGLLVSVKREEVLVYLMEKMVMAVL